jgi:hypothetical protein
LAKHKPGETVKLIYKHRGMIIEKDITLEENPFVTIVAIESSGNKITEAQKEFRQNWLESKTNASL